MCKFVLNILFLLFFILTFSHGAKILFFFAGGNYSHKSSAWAWATELANRGHEITFLSAHTKQPTKEPKIKDITSLVLNKQMAQTYDTDRFTQRRDGTQQDMFGTYGLITTRTCEALLQDPTLQHLIHNGTFDLVVINIIYGECGHLLAHHYKAKTIVYDASITLPWFYDLYGFQPESSWIPEPLYKFETFPMDYVGRFFSALWPIYWFWDRCNNIYPRLEEIMKNTYNLQEVPSVLDLERNTSLVFVNSYPAIDFACSLPPTVKMIGGLQMSVPEKPIPDKYQDFMDASGPKGVVLISFGSTVNLEKVPVYYQNIFFQLAKQFEDVRFLMKWNGSFPEGFKGGLRNLMVSDWLPQRELLRHPKLRGFVTHGGLNSIQEATYYGVPLIVLPLFADQDYNAYRINAQEVGLRLEIRDLTIQIIFKALQQILDDTKYKKNMEIKSEIFKDRPQNPMENIIYWTEFVLRHDDVSALKPMSYHLSWFQRRNLDVYLLGLIIVLSLLIFIGLVLNKIISCLFVVHNIKQSKTKRNSGKVKSS